MTRYIDADKLCELARNSIDKKVDANDIMRFPISDVQEVRHGRWINENRMYGTISAQCSVCGLFSGVWLHNAPYKYCPNCGAKLC